MSLGEKILTLRKIKGLSQEELGELVGVARQTISNWELNETSPNPEQLKLLSKELNVSIDELLDNDIKSVLETKVSNTEKLAGLILKILKIILIAIPTCFLLLIIMSIIYKNVRHNNSGMLIEETIHCKIYGEEHSYSVTYQELTGRIVAAGGDTYFIDILDLDKYSDAHQTLNVINDYVKKNGGTCEIIPEKDLNNNVSMQIKDGTLTKTSATIIITEERNYDIIYGESFYIEKYNSNTGSFEKLDEVNNNCAFNMIAYNVESDKPLELYQDWSCPYGELAKGHYRLIKNVSFNLDTPITDDNQFYIWVEFDIEY